MTDTAPAADSARGAPTIIRVEPRPAARKVPVVRLLPRFAMLLACASVAVAGAQTVYKSVGPDGRVVYSDHPPANGRVEKTMTFENLPSSELPASSSSYVEQLRRMHARDAAAQASAATSAGAGPVLYAAAWCGYCKKARAWLGGHGVAYREVDVETPAGVEAFAQAGGGRGIPLLVANGRRVQGWSPAAYESLFPSRH